MFHDLSTKYFNIFSIYKYSTIYYWRMINEILLVTGVNHFIEPSISLNCKRKLQSLLYTNYTASQRHLFILSERYILNSTSFRRVWKTLWTFALSLKKIKDPAPLKTTTPQDYPFSRMFSQLFSSILAIS